MNGSNEFFYLDENGKKQDAELYEAILAEGDEVGAFASTYALLVERGYAEEWIAATYGELYQRWRARFPSER